MDKKEKSVKNILANLAKVEVPTTSVENPATSEGTLEIGSDLENSEDLPEGTKLVVDYTNREFLENNAPSFPSEFTSKKYDAEREPKVQDGLIAIAELMPSAINPLILLLAKWWEVKPARAAIKDMIDTEAKAANQPEDVYLQITLRKNVDKMSTIQQAVDRLRYAITYFKPRAGISSKDIFKMMTIDGTMYNVNMTELDAAKLKFGEDREALKAHLKEISTVIAVDEIL